VVGLKCYFSILIVLVLVFAVFVFCTSCLEGLVVAAGSRVVVIGPKEHSLS